MATTSGSKLTHLLILAGYLLAACSIGGYVWLRVRHDHDARQSGMSGESRVPGVYRALMLGDDKTAVAMSPAIPPAEVSQVLEQAVYHGQPLLLDVLLQRNARPLEWDQYARLLTTSASFGYTDCAKLLLRNRGTREAGPSEKTALAVAAARGHIDFVRLMLQTGVPVEALGPHSLRTDQGLTPVLLAARYGHADVVQLLLKRGAQAQWLTPTGTPVIVGDGTDKPRMPGPNMDPFVPRRALLIMSSVERRRDGARAAKLLRDAVAAKERQASH